MYDILKFPNLKLIHSQHLQFFKKKHKKLVIFYIEENNFLL